MVFTGFDWPVPVSVRFPAGRCDVDHVPFETLSAVSDPYARIFLLSHMRAFTSLAGHILGSHPQINGYYEMHISYEDASALDRQLEMFRQDDVLKRDSRYLFDKLLHNDYALKPGRRHPKINLNLFAKRASDMRL
jgi:hypothetical protein